VGHWLLKKKTFRQITGQLSNQFYGVSTAVIYDSKAVPLEARSCPEDSRKLRFPYLITTVQDGGKIVSLTHQLPLPPGNAFGGKGSCFC